MTQQELDQILNSLRSHLIVGVLDQRDTDYNRGIETCMELIVDIAQFAALEPAAPVQEPAHELLWQALRAFQITQEVSRYPDDHWSQKATKLFSTKIERQPMQEPGNVEKAAYWFDTLAKCARMLDLSDAESIPSGVLRRVGELTATAAPVCVCGEPETKGTTHRIDGPCYQVERSEDRA